MAVDPPQKRCLEIIETESILNFPAAKKNEHQHFLRLGGQP